MRSILMHQAVFTFEFEYKVPTIVIPLLFFENRSSILLDGMTTRETLTLPALSKQTEFPRKVLGRFSRLPHSISATVIYFSIHFGTK